MAAVSWAIVFLMVAGSEQASPSPGPPSHGRDYQKLTAQGPPAGTCGEIKKAYKLLECCGMPDKVTNQQLVPMNPHMSKSPNPCKDKKSYTSRLGNKNCTKYNFTTAMIDALEQSGSNVTKGYQGTMDVKGRQPITTAYWKNLMCPVNVHWHLGTEHLSVGEYDETGTGPAKHIVAGDGGVNTRRLAGEAQMGFRCKKYDASDTKFVKPYVWQHCADMYVGETYEVHWPHSTLGACHTPFQYQTPFYDGVFCKAPANIVDMVLAGNVTTHTNVGVQAQIFTIVNDESYYYPDLMRGAIVDDSHWGDVAYYTGSTTGTSRSNDICSQYTPITWQVDRKCHLISASSFDKMCADMKSQHDDMSGDIYPHGSRTLPWQNLTADNFQRRM